MRIALDPYMHRHLSLEELPRKAAELGYEWIELSPRDDFLAWWVHPRAYPERIASFKKALKDHGVKIASLLPMYRWASPHEDERQTAVRYWKKAIQIAVDMGVDTMNSEFGRGPSPDRGHSANCCGGQFTHEIERSGLVALDGGVRPGAREGGRSAQHRAASRGLVRDAASGRRHDPHLGSKDVKFLYCAPHTFYFGDDIREDDPRRAASLLAHVHVADTYNHKASSGLRYICNPPGAKVTIHQHMDIGQGEVDWDVFFSSLAAIGFDGIMTACVFAWEERADESGRYMRETMQTYVDKYWTKPKA